MLTQGRAFNFGTRVCEMLCMLRTRSTQSLIDLSRSFSHNDIPFDFSFEVCGIVIFSGPPFVWVWEGLFYKSREVVVVGLEVVKFVLQPRLGEAEAQLGRDTASSRNLCFYVFLRLSRNEFQNQLVV